MISFVECIAYAREGGHTMLSPSVDDDKVMDMVFTALDGFCDGKTIEQITLKYDDGGPTSSEDIRALLGVLYSDFWRMREVMKNVD